MPELLPPRPKKRKRESVEFNQLKSEVSVTNIITPVDYDSFEAFYKGEVEILDEDETPLQW